MSELGDALSALAGKAKRLLAKDGQVGEENTKAVLVEPILQALGWDTHDLDEVQREFRYKSQDNPVDYALFISARPRLFVEAKSLGHDLGQHKWRAQSVNYANTSGVEWCVLTDGNFWQVYKSNAPGDLEQKLFLETWLHSPEGRTPPFGPRYVLSLLARDKLAENEIETLWQVLNVDRKGREALLAMIQEKDAGLVRLIRGRADLTQKQVEAFLSRAEVSLDTPQAQISGAVPSTAGKKAAAVRRQLGGLPSQRALEVPLLRAIVARGGEVRVKQHGADMYAALAQEFDVSEQQQKVVLSDGKTTAWSNRIRRTRLRLVKSGDLDGSQRGVWTVTEQGQRRAAEPRSSSLPPLGRPRFDGHLDSMDGITESR